jgi:hypothetical protein
MKNIESFSNFVGAINEGDGFGTAPYLMVKVSDVYHYFFTMENFSGKEEMGFHLIIGKYSDHESIDGAKNSYCVISLNEISTELIEDIAVDKEEIPPSNNEKFTISDREMPRLMKLIFGCLYSYLELSPKITRIYDEIQDSLSYNGSKNYIDYMKELAEETLGSNWSAQEGASKNSIILSR